jgi:hypothetical protein
MDQASGRGLASGLTIYPDLARRPRRKQVGATAQQGTSWNFIVYGLTQTTIGAGLLLTATVNISPETP